MAAFDGTVLHGIEHLQAGNDFAGAKAAFDEARKVKPLPADMQALYDPEEASVVWYSPAYHTASAKWTSTVSSTLLLEGGWEGKERALLMTGVCEI